MTLTQTLTPALTKYRPRGRSRGTRPVRAKGMTLTPALTKHRDESVVSQGTPTCAGESKESPVLRVWRLRRLLGPLRLLLCFTL